MNPFSLFDPPSDLETIKANLERVSELVESIADKLDASTTIDPKARYPMEEAAEFLGISVSTLRRRARTKKIILRYDGKRPFISGAELLRYAHKGAATYEAACKSVSK